MKKKLKKSTKQKLTNLGLLGTVFVIGLFGGILAKEPILSRISGVVSLNQDLPSDIDYTEVEQVYDSLRTNFDGQLSIEDIINGLKDGITSASGDPFTEFLDNEESQIFDNELEGSFTGIGAELSKDGDFIVIVAPLEGYPAEKAGLRPKDIIVEINGERAVDISITEAVKKIRGEAGTVVELKILRGKSEELDIKITRQEIKVPSVKYEIKEGNIGYLKISRFGSDTASLSHEAALYFKSQKTRSVILDLRSNPGGLLDASVDVSSLWLESGTVVLEEKRGGTTLKTFRAKGNAPLLSVPTVILVNEGSASASEIIAGALSDHKAATIVGVKTYGKGSVQKLIDFNNGTKLKVTIARWFTPNGNNIDKEGIEPDVIVERTEDDYLSNRDPQLKAALDRLR